MIYPKIKEIIRLEEQRQKNGINLIASENYASKAVLEAMGSVLTNKYSEGYPGNRYYAGNKFIDEAESLAIELAKKLFNAEHANVQPYSGSPANMAVYLALLNLNDKILSMELSHGGHLTHGSRVNFSGKLFNFIHYGVNEKGFLDYKKIREIALKEKPNMIISGFTAYPREIDFKKFHKIAKEVNAISFADISHIAGLITSGMHNSPFPFTDVVMTTTHKTLRGPRGAIILCKKEFAEKIDKMVFPGLQGGPHNHINAAKAVALNEAMQPEFKEYGKQIVKNAKALANELIKHDFNLVSNGTDNHLILIDLTNKNITGKEAQDLLEEVNIYVNKNMIPYDKRNPFNPSGIRIGTPAATTRNMKEEEMKIIAELINKTIENKDNSKKNKIRQEVIELCGRFPIP